MNLREKLAKIKAEQGIEGVGRLFASPLARMAQSFSTSRLLGLGGRDPFKQMDSTKVAFNGLQFLTERLAAFEWPVAPQVGYRGLKQVKMADDESIDEAMAMFVVKGQTASGVNIEFEIPLAIRHGEFMEPSVMLVDGAPRVMCQAVIDGIMKRGTFSEPFDLRGGIYTPPLDREIRDQMMVLREKMGVLPHVNRGMWFVGQAGPKDCDGNLINIGDKIQSLNTDEIVEVVGFDSDPGILRVKTKDGTEVRATAGQNRKVGQRTPDDDARTQAIDDVQRGVDEGLTPEEISAKLSMPLDTVRYIMDTFVEGHEGGRVAALQRAVARVAQSIARTAQRIIKGYSSRQKAVINSFPAGTTTRSSGDVDFGNTLDKLNDDELKELLDDKVISIEDNGDVRLIRASGVNRKAQSLDIHDLKPGDKVEGNKGAKGTIKEIINLDDPEFEPAVDIEWESGVFSGRTQRLIWSVGQEQYGIKKVGQRTSDQIEIGDKVRVKHATESGSDGGRVVGRIGREVLVRRERGDTFTLDPKYLERVAQRVAQSDNEPERNEFQSLLDEIWEDMGQPHSTDSFLHSLTFRYGLPDNAVNDIVNHAETKEDVANILDKAKMFGGRNAVRRVARLVDDADIDKIINLRQSGLDLVLIADELNLDYQTVATVWAQYEDQEKAARLQSIARTAQPDFKVGDAVEAEGRPCVVVEVDDTLDKPYIVKRTDGGLLAGFSFAAKELTRMEGRYDVSGWPKESRRVAQPEVEGVPSDVEMIRSMSRADYTDEEIARALGVGVGQVQSILQGGGPRRSPKQPPGESVGEPSESFEARRASFFGHSVLPVIDDAVQGAALQGEMVDSKESLLAAMSGYASDAQALAWVRGMSEDEVVRALDTFIRVSRRAQQDIKEQDFVDYEGVKYQVIGVDGHNVELEAEDGGIIEAPLEDLSLWRGEYQRAGRAYTRLPVVVGRVAQNMPLINTQEQLERIVDLPPKGQPQPGYHVSQPPKQPPKETLYPKYPEVGQGASGVWYPSTGRMELDEPQTAPAPREPSSKPQPATETEDKPSSALSESEAYQRSIDRGDDMSVPEATPPTPEDIRRYKEGPSPAQPQAIPIGAPPETPAPTHRAPSHHKQPSAPEAPEQPTGTEAPESQHPQPLSPTQPAAPSAPEPPKGAEQPTGTMRDFFDPQGEDQPPPPPPSPAENIQQLIQKPQPGYEPASQAPRSYYQPVEEPTEIVPPEPSQSNPNQQPTADPRTGGKEDLMEIPLTPEQKAWEKQWYEKGMPPENDPIYDQPPPPREDDTVAPAQVSPEEQHPYSSIPPEIIPPEPSASTPPKQSAKGLKAPDPSLNPLKGKDFTVGVRVQTTKGKAHRSRGGGTYNVPKGSEGEIVKDIFQDGTRFNVRIDHGGEVEYRRNELARVEQVSVLLVEAERLAVGGATTGDIMWSLMRRGASRETVKAVLDNAERLGII